MAAILVPAAFALGLFVAGGMSAGSRPAPVDGTPSSASALAVMSQLHLPTEVLRVVDGDTFEARVQVWPGLAITSKIRLRGIDAPELKANCAEEQRRADAARAALQTMLAAGGVGVFNVSQDKYGGRVVADAAADGTPNVSAALLSRGLARSYHGGRRAGWCDDRRGF
jgi:endonuclease YncB( thermonuclease family)